MTFCLLVSPSLWTIIFRRIAAFVVKGIKPVDVASLVLQLCLFSFSLIARTSSFSLHPLESLTPRSLCQMCLSSTQPLHAAASGIVGKLHRLLKIAQTATLWAIFLLGWSRRSRRTRRGGPKSHFMVKIRCELRRQKTKTTVTKQPY